MIFVKHRIWEYSKSDYVKLEKILRKYEPKIGQKADIHGLKNKIHQTPLFYAVKNGSSKCVSILLTMSNIDVMAKDYYGDTVLHLACRLNYSEIVQLIVGSCREVVNVPRSNLLTPIFDAIMNKNLEIVKCLMENGACVNQTKLNEMAIELALQNKSLDIVSYLAAKFNENPSYQFQMKTLWKAVNIMHKTNEEKIVYFKQIYGSLYPKFDPKEENYDLEKILPIVIYLNCLIFHLIERNPIKFKQKADIITEFLNKFGHKYAALVILCHEDMKVLDINLRNIICVNFIDALAENLVDDKNVYEALYTFFRFLKAIRHLFEGNSHFKIFQQICFFMNLNRDRILKTDHPNMMVISCFKEFILWTISINMVTYDLLPYYKKLADFINEERFCQQVMSTMTPEIYWDIENIFEKFKRLPKILLNCLPFQILQKICPFNKNNSPSSSFFLSDTEIVIQGRRRRRLANSENTLKLCHFNLNDHFKLANFCRTVIRETIFGNIFKINSEKSFQATGWRENVFRESIFSLNLPKRIENYLIFIE